SIEKITAYATANDMTMLAALKEVEHIGLSKRATNSIVDFAETITQWGQMQDFLSINELVEEVLDKSGYREMLENERSIEAQSRLENLEEFMTVTNEFEKRSEDKSLIAFLTDLALIADIDQLDEEDDETLDEAITLMT